MLNVNRTSFELIKTKRQSAESSVQKTQQSTKSEQAAFEAALKQAQNKSSDVRNGLLSALESKERSASFGSELDWFLKKDNELVAIEPTTQKTAASGGVDNSAAIPAEFVSSALISDSDQVADLFDGLQHSAELIDWLDEVAEHEREGRWDFELQDSDNQPIALHIARHHDGKWSASVNAASSQLTQNSLDIALKQKGVFVTWEDFQ